MTLVTKGLMAEVGLLAGAVAAPSVPAWVTSLGLLLAGVLLKALIDQIRDGKIARMKAAEALAAAAHGRDLKIAALDKAQGITAAVLEMFRKELTHYHTPELDALMLIPFWALTDAQSARMAVLLAERSRDHSNEIPFEEQEVAKLYMPMLRRATAEIQVLKTGRMLQTVAVTLTEPNGEA